ncbi:hypothetical protein [Methanobrevibacter arboriphilus]|uniref:hypothetical protein n=1 Tax=Methanobrevibacter arboriphilus TaxID=39441 RepID=UPI000B1D4874|nr:hypothetical protein [Methanobrevibacter arboriphilus]
MPYGDAETVKRKLSLDDGVSPDDELIEDALKTANAEIEGRLKKIIFLKLLVQIIFLMK